MTRTTETEYAPAEVIDATEQTVTIRTRGVDTAISWSLLADCVHQGGQLGMIYYHLSEQAHRLLHASRCKRILAAGYTIGSRQVGQRFGHVGVIRLDGVEIMTGAMEPFSMTSAAERAVVEQWVRSGARS